MAERLCADDQRRQRRRRQGADHRRGGLAAADTLAFDGSAETDGRFNVLGGAGADKLVGGAGIDTLAGGLGVDKLVGGLGNDVFDFLAVAETGVGAGNRDSITDFQVAGGDRISLFDIDANATLAGNQAFAFIGSNAFSGVKGQLHFAAVNGNTIVEGDVNGDAVADFQIVLIGTHALTAAEFLL